MKRIHSKKPLAYVAFRASQEEVQQVKQIVKQERAKGEKLVESDVYRYALALFLESVFTERKEVQQQ